MTRKEAEQSIHPIPEVEIGQHVAVPYKGHYHEAQVIQPEVYWPEKRSQYEARVELDDGKRAWVLKKNLILREQ